MRPPARPSSPGVYIQCPNFRIRTTRDTVPLRIVTSSIHPEFCRRLAFRTTQSIGRPCDGRPLTSHNDSRHRLTLACSSTHPRDTRERNATRACNAPDHYQRPHLALVRDAMNALRKAREIALGGKSRLPPITCADATLISRSLCSLHQKVQRGARKCTSGVTRRPIQGQPDR
jgi:hypothetical protein